MAKQVKFGEKDLELVKRIEDFQKELEVAERAYEARDLIGFIDILDFSIGDLLIEFYDNVEDYYNDIAEEENRKRLLN